jgi:hypothetical protein
MICQGVGAWQVGLLAMDITVARAVRDHGGLPHGWPGFALDTGTAFTRQRTGSLPAKHDCAKFRASPLPGNCNCSPEIRPLLGEAVAGDVRCVTSLARDHVNLCRALCRYSARPSAELNHPVANCLLNSHAENHRCIWRRTFDDDRLLYLCQRAS